MAYYRRMPLMKQTTLLHDSLGRTTSRRQVLLGGLAAIIAAGKAPGALIRSSLASAHQRDELGGEDFQNPYVTDGLVAMWDGEWNAGLGVHISNPMSIYDISGNGHTLYFTGIYSIGPNYVYIDGTSGAYGFVQNFRFGVPTTQETCIEIELAHRYGRIIGENRGLCIYYEGQPGYIYGFGTDGFVNGTTNIGLNIPFSYSLAVADGCGRVFVNGVYQGRRPTINSQYEGTTYIFGRNTSGRGITGKFFNIRFYSRTLSAEEIAYNYTIDKERFGLP